MKRFLKFGFMFLAVFSLALFVACDDSSGSDSGGNNNEIVPVTGISITNVSEEVTIGVGDSITFDVEVYPSNATDKSYTCTGTNPSALSLSLNLPLVVEAIGEGSSTVTVTSNDGAFEDTCTVTVSGGASGYTLTIYNRTQGMLSDVYIGTHSCGDMDVDESCSYSYESKPETIMIYKSSGSDIGYNYESSITHVPGAGTSGSENLTLPSNYWALWVRNQSSYPIDFIGFQWNGDNYAAGYNLTSPITNNGAYRFMGFITTLYYNIDLWSGENYVEFNGITTQTNTYGSKYQVLNVTP